MKRAFALISILLIGFYSGIAQIRTLIPIEQEVDLPLDSTGTINLTTVFNETVFSTTELKTIFLSESKKNLDTSRFHLIDTSKNAIEFFVIYPCKTFNINNIHAGEVINEGLISSILLIKFRENEYEIELKEFYWERKGKPKENLSQIFYDYNVLEDLKFQVSYYGILKSAEHSIVSSVDYFTMIIQEIINRKSKK